MKKIFLALLAGVTLASCSEISTDPAPARATRSQTVSLTYSLSTPATASDTVLVNPKIEVYLIQPQIQSDGSSFYPLTSGTPLATLTPTTTSQTFAFPNNPIVVSDSQPNPIVRLVFSSDNLPGRKGTLASSGVATTTGQRIITGLLVNTTATRVTTTYSGFDFARRTATPPPAAPFRKTTDLSIAAY